MVKYSKNFTQPSSRTAKTSCICDTDIVRKIVNFIIKVFERKGVSTTLVKRVRKHTNLGIRIPSAVSSPT